MNKDELITFMPDTIDWPVCPRCGCVLTGKSHACTPWVFRRHSGAVIAQSDERSIWCLHGYQRTEGE